MEPEKKGSKLPVIAAAAVIAVGGIGAYSYLNKGAPEGGRQPSANQNDDVPQDLAQAAASPYKDGTYSATGDYVSPGGPEQIGLSLTLKNGVITDATFTPMATRPISVTMQTAVSENYKPLVIGKNIDEVNLTKVSGSSLTPGGFNDAVAKIKAQARS